jgi:integrase
MAQTSAVGVRHRLAQLANHADARLHIQPRTEFDLKPADLLLPGEKGGLLAGSVFRRVWAKAREEILDEHEFESPTGKRVYDLRHTCLTTWLNNGIPPAQVAEWAGNSVPVLLAIYARCVVGQLDDYLKRIEDVQALPKVAV